MSQSNSNNPSDVVRYCSRCGAPLPSGATFCSSCGAAVVPSTTGGTTPPPPEDRHAYREWRRQERRQYTSEKYEKQEKAEKHEKGRGGRGSLLGPIVGALILIWLGITLYLQQTTYIAGNWWAYFIAGVGVIVIIQGVARYYEYRGPYVGSVIGGAILVLIGLSFISGFSSNFWPLILVVIGVVLVVSSLTARRNRPAPSTPPS